MKIATVMEKLWINRLTWCGGGLGEMKVKN